MLNSLKNLFAVLVTAVILVPAAHAATYQATVNGTTYDFTTITGTANDNQQLLSEQPWFDNQPLAETFASALADNLGGTVNGGELGPLFAYAGDVTGIRYMAYMYEDYVDLITKVDVSRTFAVASAVPVPEIDGALLPQALMLLGATALFIRRRGL